MWMIELLFLYMPQIWNFLQSFLYSLENITTWSRNLSKINVFCKSTYIIDSHNWKRFEIFVVKIHIQNRISFYIIPAYISLRCQGALHCIKNSRSLVATLLILLSIGASSLTNFIYLLICTTITIFLELRICDRNITL
jgi:hypothetical protein